MHDHHGHHHVEFDSAEMAATTEEEGDALVALTAAAVAATVAQCDALGVPVRRVIDLGSGPGVGSCALATGFPRAAVVAADSAAAMLERAAVRAARLGVADRVSTVLVVLPDAIDDLPVADVVWVSMALHHVGDEADALARIHRRLAPAGTNQTTPNTTSWPQLESGRQSPAPSISNRCIPIC